MANEDESYRRSAETVYAQMREMQQFSLKMMGEYGRWLVSSLLLLHGAAISGLLFRAASTSAPTSLVSLLWFVAGIVLALGAGFAAWWNFVFAAEQFADWADHRMLTNRSYWPKEGSTVRIEATKWCAIGCGILSVIFLVAGAAHVFCSLR